MTDPAGELRDMATPEAANEPWRAHHAAALSLFLAEYDRRADRDQLAAALTGERRTRQQLWNILGRRDGVGLDIELLDAVADAIDSRNRYRAELDRLEGADPVEPCPEQGIGDHDCAEHQLGCFRCGHDPLDDHHAGGCTRCGCTSPFGGLT